MEEKFKLKDVATIAKKILDIVKDNRNSKATIITLSGDLGAGKTRITQEFGKLLDVSERIISPTFVIMKIYKVKPTSKYYSSFKKLIHIDAYRLNSGEELNSIGFEELVSDKDNLIVIEWPERIEECLNKKTFYPVFIEHIDDETRMIKFLL